MYMPYLHGKQEELLAVSALSPSLTNLVVPIFKPVNVDASDTVGRLARIGSNNARYALITNSDKGRQRQPPTYAQAVAVIRDPSITANSQNVFPAFEIRGDSPLSDLDRFSRDFADRRCVVVHKSHTYTPAQLRSAMHFIVDPVHVYIEPGVSAASFSALPSVARIVVRDGFKACERNSAYPAQSAFDDIVYQYRLRNFDGFGDFCMIGDTYSESGGPASAVALHLTEYTGSSLLTNHFKSSSVGVDTKTMYFEALRGLVSYVGAPTKAHLSTQGLGEYLQSDAARHFPNLGPAKRWSTMHHIELVHQMLVSQNVTALF